MNQYLDQRLRPYVSYYQDNWSELLPMMDHAQLVLPHSTLGMSPFELQKGYPPRTSFDWQVPKPANTQEKLSQEEARTISRSLQEVLDVGRANMLKAQQKKERDVNRHRRDVDFGVGDMVFVTTKDWVTHRPSRKLDHQMAGPFKILEEVGSAFRLQLPSSIKVHPVFAPEKLRKALNDP